MIKLKSSPTNVIFKNYFLFKKEKMKKKKKKKEKKEEKKEKEVNSHTSTTA